MKGFISFIREQRVIGLATGFILGGSIKQVVTSLVEDLVNPLLGILLGATEGLETAIFRLGSAEIKIGSFISSLIDFLVIALIIYYGVKGLGLERLDRKKK